MRCRGQAPQLVALSLLVASAAVHAGDSTPAAASAIPVVRIQATQPGPELKSAAALIFDPRDSAVLYARRANVASPIASITKLMTALVVLEAKQPLDEQIEIVAIDKVEGKGTYSRLPVGTRLSRADLLRLALMASENRAAYALGRSYPGGMRAFVKAMNAKAKALGMKNSRFVEPTGLSRENVASAMDLVKLVTAAAENPIIREYSTDPEHSVRIGNQILEFHNTNLLVKNPDWNIAVQKTGYIRAAGRCLVMQTDIGGRPIVMVLLHSVGKYTRTADAKRVRRWLETKAAEAVERMVASGT